MCETITKCVYNKLCQNYKFQIINYFMKKKEKVKYRNYRSIWFFWVSVKYWFYLKTFKCVENVMYIQLDMLIILNVSNTKFCK